MPTLPKQPTSIAKGLDAIFCADSEIIDGSTKPLTGIEQVNIKTIVPSPFQARKNFSKEQLDQLSESIKVNGLIQPIVVRQHHPHQFELIAGERRLRASKLAGLSSIPVIQIDVDDAAAMAFGLIENIQREDLNPMEEAEAYERLLEEFQLTHEELAKRVGKSRAYITNMVRLNSASEKVQKSLRGGQISMGHARALLSWPYEQQDKVLRIVLEKELTVRQIEKMSQEKCTSIKRSFRPRTAEEELELQALIKQLSQKIRCSKIETFTRKGKSILSFTTDSVDELKEMLMCILNEIKD